MRQILSIVFESERMSGNMQIRQFFLLVSLLVPVGLASAASQWPIVETRDATPLKYLACYLATASSEEGKGNKKSEDEEPDCE